MGRDLAHSGYTWSDVGGRLPFDQFVSFAVYSPPGTAVFHRINEGMVAGDYLLAQVVNGVNDLLWSKTKDAMKDPPRNRPKRVWLPGMPKDEEPEQTKSMTVAEYMQKRQERKGK